MKYCNENGRKRLDGHERLEDVFLNYEHIPIKKALHGVATQRREITWITQDRTFEDITLLCRLRLAAR